MDRDAAAWPGGCPRRVVAIVNPATRRDADAAIAALRRAAPEGVDLDIHRTAGPGDAMRLANQAAERAEVVVAVGGDGTVAEVASGLHGGAVPLGIVPAGSTNITARELGIPTNLDAAAALLFGRHRLATIDVGRCGDRSFLHMAGAGLDSRFFERTDRDLKRRVGWLAYLPAAALSLRLPPARFAIVADGREMSVTSPLVLVANGGSIITPGLRLHPAISATDGWLDLLVFTATARLPIAGTLGRLATLRLENSPFLITTKARHIEVAADPPLPIQLDGDVVSQTPKLFSVEPLALSVLAPQSRLQPTKR